MKIGNTILTPTGIEVDGTPHVLSKQRRRLLERLVRAGGHCVDHDVLLDTLWDGRPDGPEPKAVAAALAEEGYPASPK